MQLGMVGLGRMGASMTERLVRGGHRVVGFDPKTDARQHVERVGAEHAAALDALVAKLAPPRAVWLMVPSGHVTEATIAALLPLLGAGDTIIDGGNSNYNDTNRREHDLKAEGLRFVGSGVSGGETGALWGPSLMPGGDPAA